MKIFYLLFASFLFLSCNQDDESITTTSISENDLLGRWSVSYSEVGSTVDLTGYIFEFETNNLLTIINEENVIEGEWEIILVNSAREVKILIPKKENPLRVVHDYWDVNSVSPSAISLSEINSENGFLKNVQFIRL